MPVGNTACLSVDWWTILNTVFKCYCGLQSSRFRDEEPCGVSTAAEISHAEPSHYNALSVAVCGYKQVRKCSTCSTTTSCATRASWDVNSCWRGNEPPSPSEKSTALSAYSFTVATYIPCLPTSIACITHLLSTKSSLLVAHRLFNVLSCLWHLSFIIH